MLSCAWHFLPPPGSLNADVYQYASEPLRDLATGEFRIETIYTTIDAGTRASIDSESDYVIKLRAGVGHRRTRC
jgi:hypothetical protein